MKTRDDNKVRCLWRSNERREAWQQLTAPAYYVT